MKNSQWISAMTISVYTISVYGFLVQSTSVH